MLIPFFFPSSMAFHGSSTFCSIQPSRFSLRLTKMKEIPFGFLAWSKREREIIALVCVNHSRKAAPGGRRTLRHLLSPLRRGVSLGRTNARLPPLRSRPDVCLAFFLPSPHTPGGSFLFFFPSSRSTCFVSAGHPLGPLRFTTLRLLWFSDTFFFLSSHWIFAYEKGKKTLKTR